jgi:hypothetical protein
MEAKNMGLMSETDNTEKDIRILNSWLTQWESYEFRDYTSKNTILYSIGNMLFLIPKEEKLTRPIRVIIA